MKSDESNEATPPLAAATSGVGLLLMGPPRDGICPHLSRGISAVGLQMRALILAFACLGAQAQTIGLHMASLHIPNSGLQSFNPGLYYKSQDGITVGAYRNSLNRLSVYAGLTIENGPFALTGGILYGYQRRSVCTTRPAWYGGTTTACEWSDGSPGAFLPLFAPSVRLPSIGGISPRITLMPGFRGSSTAIHLSLEREIGL